MLKLTENFDLSASTTFGVPAKAARYVEIKTRDDLQELINSGLLTHDNILILGEGSNILFNRNFDGLVIKNCLTGISIKNVEQEEVLITAGGGENWDKLVEFSCSANYYGLENLSLIPGTVGASPVQNIGAYGVELKDVFVSCETINIITGEEKTFNREDCEFEYRNSIFKRSYKNKLLITSVTFALSVKPTFNLSYRELHDQFENYNKTSLTSRIIRDFVIKVRESKLPDPKTIGNAGSFFKNPEVDKDIISQLEEKLGRVLYYQTNDKYKIPAAWLIESCGLKGKREGNVGTYHSQPLVIVNYGVKHGSEIVNFSKYIQEQVFNKFGIMLEPEVNIL